MRQDGIFRYIGTGELLGVQGFRVDEAHGGACVCFAPTFKVSLRS